MHNLNYCHRLILMVLSLVLFGSVLAELRIQDTRTTKGIPLQTTDNKLFEGIYKDAKVRFDLDESGKLSVAGKRVALCIYRGMTRIYPTESDIQTYIRMDSPVPTIQKSVSLQLQGGELVFIGLGASGGWFWRAPTMPTYDVIKQLAKETTTMDSTLAKGKQKGIFNIEKIPSIVFKVESSEKTPVTRRRRDENTRVISPAAITAEPIYTVTASPETPQIIEMSSRPASGQIPQESWVDTIRRRIGLFMVTPRPVQAPPSTPLMVRRHSFSHLPRNPAEDMIRHRISLFINQWSNVPAEPIQNTRGSLRRAHSADNLVAYEVPMDQWDDYPATEGSPNIVSNEQPTRQVDVADLIPEPIRQPVETPSRRVRRIVLRPASTEPILRQPPQEIPPANVTRDGAPARRIVYLTPEEPPTTREDFLRAVEEPLEQQVHVTRVQSVISNHPPSVVEETKTEDTGMVIDEVTSNAPTPIIATPSEPVLVNMKLLNDSKNPFHLSSPEALKTASKQESTNMNAILAPKVTSLRRDYRIYVSRHDPTLYLNVKHSDVLNSFINQLLAMSPADFRRPLNVHYTDQDGSDVGGVKRDFFSKLTAQFMAPELGLFYQIDDTTMAVNVHPLSQDNNPQDEVMFELFGKVMAWAFIQESQVNAFIPEFLFKAIMGREQEITGDDLFVPDPVGYKKLHFVLDAGKDELPSYGVVFQEDQDLNGAIKSYALVEGGGAIDVTADNRNEWAHYYLAFRTVGRTTRQIAAIRRGLFSIIPEALLKDFTSRQLSLLFSGDSDINVADWKAHTDYQYPYREDHPNIQMFWRAVSEMNQQQLQKLLFFMTALYRVPPGGFSELRDTYGTRKFRIKPMKVPPGSKSTPLPRGHTCFYTLDLPEYSSFEEMKNKILMAIEYTEGFDEKAVR